MDVYAGGYADFGVIQLSSSVELITEAGAFHCSVEIVKAYWRRQSCGLALA